MYRTGESPVACGWMIIRERKPLSGGSSARTGIEK